MYTMKRGEDAAEVFFRRQLAKVLEQHVRPHIGRPKRIADVGCGTGYWLEYMHRWTWPLERDAWPRFRSQREYA